MTLSKMSFGMTGVVAASMLVMSCSSEPEIKADRLASRSSVEIDARISNSTAVRSGAIPRDRKANANAAEGAGTGVAMWFSDPFLAAVAVTVPVVIPMSAAAGGAIGGAHGAATGVSATPEEINSAINTLSSSFRPLEYQGQFEADLAKAFRARIAPASNTCVAARHERGKCSRGAQPGYLHVRSSFLLDISRSDAGAGGLDIASSITVWADPRGLVEPNCISWTYRTRAGNLIELAQNGAAPMKAKMGEILRHMAYDLSYLLLPRTGSIPAPATPSTEGRTASPRSLNPAEYRLMSATDRGRNLIKRGFYVLEDEMPRSQPRKLNSAEYRLMSATDRGRNLIKRGFYVLDESSPPPGASRNTQAVRTINRSRSGRWTRQSCDYAILSGLEKIE